MDARNEMLRLIRSRRGVTARDCDSVAATKPAVNFEDDNSDFAAATTGRNLRRLAAVGTARRQC